VDFCQAFSRAYDRVWKPIRPAPIVPIDGSPVATVEHRSKQPWVLRNGHAAVYRGPSLPITFIYQDWT
jgi:hypothetical protein